MARRTCEICGADVGSAEFSTCGRHACQRAALGREAGSDDGEPAPDRPAPETEQARRDRFHTQRVAHVRASWERGRRCLLARALDPTAQDWARCEPRGKVVAPTS